MCQNDTFPINILSNFWICTAWTVISGSGPIFFDIKWLPTVQRICQKCLQWNQNFRQNTVWTKKWFRLELVSMELNHIARFTYLAIYISQKIRLCVADLEGKFQTNLQAKSITFSVWICYTHLSSIIWRILQIHCFLQELTCLNYNLMQKSKFKYVNSLE